VRVAVLPAVFEHHDATHAWLGDAGLVSIGAAAGQ
jgi:hypothetical protein